VLSKNTILYILKIPLLVLFVLFFHSFGIVASWGIAMGIAVAVALFLFLPKIQNPYKPVPTLSLSLIKDMWQYSGGNYLASLFTAAPTMVLPIMVVNLLGPVQNAYFYIAWAMAYLLFAIPLTVSQSLFAEGSHFEDRLRQNVLKSFKFTFLLLVPAVILLILIGKWLLLAFGQSYSVNALRLLQVLAISSLPLGINYIYSSILRVTGRIVELTAIWGFIAIAVLAVSYLIMLTTGIIGVGYAWLGANTAAAIYIIIARRQLRRR
jgi:O-antigen/teichoic acid export membrane protein